MLPGRENRIKEPAERDIAVLADRLAEQIRPLPGDLVLFGHSFGALVAFELAHRLVALGTPRLRLLAVAGCAAPPFEDWTPLAALPRTELVARLKAFGGLPAEALEFPELFDMMLPTLRADLAIVDAYQSGPGAVLPIPIHAMYGTGDPQCDGRQARQWGRYTHGDLTVSAHPGSHFFPFENPAPVLAALERALAGEEGGSDGDD